MATLMVSHEAASQRRHFRLTTPAEVTIGGVPYATDDWSVGGFRVSRFTAATGAGERISLTFRLNFQGFGISFEALAEVVRRNGDTLAARFVNLGEREASLLEEFTAAVMSGRMTSIGGVLRQLDRPVTKLTVAPPSEMPLTGRKRVARRFLIAACYLVAGILVARYALLIMSRLWTQVTVETAVTSLQLEQVVSTDAGAIQELTVKPGDQVKAGQMLLRVDSELADRQAELAQQTLRSAEIDLTAATDAVLQERTKLTAYHAISRDQLEGAAARVRQLGAEKEQAKSEFDRVQKLWDNGVISRQAYEAGKAQAEKIEAELDQALAEQKVLTNSSQTTDAGFFFSGNFLVGDLQTRLAEEQAARERVALARLGCENAMRHVASREYRAPFPAVVMRVFKTAGMTVERGEAIVVLRRSEEQAYIDAFLTQEEAGRVGIRTRGTAFIPAQGKRYSVEVQAIDRTSGFLKEIQTPKLQQPQFGWRNPQDRSALVKLVFVGVSGDELRAMPPGLPVTLTIPRKRDTWWLQLATVHAADYAPALWPATSPLFRAGGLSTLRDPDWPAVRDRVLEAAARAERKEPAPVRTLHSAGETDQSSPEFVASRRAFQDADNFAVLALAYKLSGKTEYRNAARKIIDAWARVNQPTGNPIDETRLDGFLWGLDLLGQEGQSTEVRGWLERWYSAKRNWEFGPKTASNNHKTHQLKIELMLDRYLGRNNDYERDLAEAIQHEKVNLGFENGSSLDYRERDAMHYHVFDLEAWTEIALLTGCCRANVDRAFGFFERTMNNNPGHVEFRGSSAPIDRKRAAAGFDYAKEKPYESSKAARAILAYETLPGSRVPEELRKIAGDDEKAADLFYRARYYLWGQEK